MVRLLGITELIEKYNEMLSVMLDLIQQNLILPYIHVPLRK